MSDEPTATAVLDEIAHLRGWDDEKKIELMLEFIEFDQEADLEEKFIRFLEKKAAEEG